MNMKNFYLIAFCLLSFNALCQEAIEEAVYKDGVATPLCIPQGAHLDYRFMELGGTGFTFHFDRMGTDWEDLRFTVIHCDHLWVPTDLEQNEYLRGFAFQDINQIEGSFNTQLPYVHYQFSFPNDLMAPTLSGNYAILVYEGDDWSDRASWWTSYRVVVYEQKVNPSGRVSGSSVISQRFTHHEVDFSIFNPNFPIPNPVNELHVSILQNYHWPSGIFHLKPIFIKSGELVYDYQGENNFPGGSEYRSFDTKSVQFITAEVADIRQEADGVHAYLLPDLLHGTRAYETLGDINGVYLVRNDLGGDSHLEAEYLWVHFRLQCPPITEARVFIEGLLENSQKNNFEMVYSENEKCYTFKALLKQGFYNYRYRLVDLYHPGGDFGLTEGNHFETDNVYSVIVYMRDRSFGYDRVIAMKELRSRQ